MKIARRCDLQLRYARKLTEDESDTAVGIIVKELTEGKIPDMVHPLPGPHVTVTAADFDFWVGAPHS